MAKLLLNADDGPRIIADISGETCQYFERKPNSIQYGRRIPK
jgi:hypothetical protein